MGILGILRFTLSLRRLRGVHVRCVDTYYLRGRPQRLTAVFRTTRPARGSIEASVSEAMTPKRLRSEETRRPWSRRSASAALVRCPCDVGERDLGQADDATSEVDALLNRGELARQRAIEQQ